ncbi:MAG: DUF2064 domain-containing protein [Elusimicrobiaceae bacterium]|nr:DUF2064 domain-containing protein [Elusimicrobiaceae bacterium]
MRNAIVFFAALPGGGTRHPLNAELKPHRAEKLVGLFHEDCAERLHGSADIIVCYDPRAGVEQYRARLGEDCRYIAQTGASDSEKLAHAVRFAFEQAYDRVVAVGIACPDLPTETYGSAFAALGASAACCGRVKTGNYYLLGLSKTAYEPGAFDGISMTGSGAFRVCGKPFERRFESCTELAQWPGVETAQALRDLYRRNFDSAFTGSKTFAYMRENAGEVGVS